LPAVCLSFLWCLGDSSANSIAAAVDVAAVVLQMMCSVLGIALGTALSAYGEVNINLPGLLLMFSSEVFEAVRLVMTQLLLTGQRMTTMEGLMWLVSGWLAGATLCVVCYS